MKNIAKPLFIFLLTAVAAFPQEATSKTDQDLTSDAGSFSDYSSEDLINSLATELEKQNTDFCHLVVPISRELLNRDNTPADIQTTYNDAKFRCSIDEKRWKDASKHVNAIIKTPVWKYGLLDVRVALLAEEYDTAIQRTKAAATLKDDRILYLNYDVFWSFYRHFKRNGQIERANEFIDIVYQSPLFSELAPPLTSSVASHIIEEQAKTGRFEDSKYLINLMFEHYQFIGKLGSRKFATIWPELESAAGENLINLSERSLDYWRTRYETDTNDKVAFNSLAHALHFSGKFESAIQLASTIKRDQEKLATLTEDDFWVLNIEAYALDSLGRYDEAERTFDNIASVPLIPGKNDWLVNFVINRASRLVAMGQWDKGLKAANFAETFRGNAYAKMLILKAKVCALHNLRKTKKARAIAKEIFKSRKDSHTVAVEAFLCLEDKDKAAKIAVEAFKDEDSQAAIIEKLQDTSFELFYSTKLLPTIHNTLRNHPEVKQLFEKHARKIPARFTPVASIRREKIASGN